MPRRSRGRASRSTRSSRLRPRWSSERSRPPSSEGPLEPPPGKLAHVAEHVIAFAPGRVNLIGEHTDYNQGLALPFAIGAGVTVSADPIAEPRIEAIAVDLGER